MFYTSLVQYILEYVLKIFRMFLRYLWFKLHLIASSESYRNSMGLDSLQSHRVKTDLCFQYKIMNGVLDCPDLLALISFRVSSKETRNTEVT